MQQLRILLVDAQAADPQALWQQFACDSCQIVAAATAEDNLLALVKQYRPDVVIIDMDAPSRDSIDSLGAVQAAFPHPMVLFSQDDDSEIIRRAVEAGVSAYVVDGIQAHRIRPILDAAIARFQRYRTLSGELDRTRRQLEERKLVERAKGIIMAQRKLSEPAAYQLLRKAAMDRNQRISEVADTIISAASLLGAEAP